MADVADVYGNQFQSQSFHDRIKNVARLLGTNIAHKNFPFRLEAESVFCKHNMHEEAIKQVIIQVQATNKMLRLTHVNKLSDKINIFPYLINGPVEYFVLTDLAEKKLIMLYISPKITEPF